MFKFIAGFLGVMITVAGVGTIILLATGGDAGVMLDRLNPAVEMDDYYTKVTEDGEHLGKDKIHKDEESYAYTFQAYNEAGDPQTIKLNALKNLKHDAYLKIIAKGKNGKSFEQVNPEEIPAQALEKLDQ